MSKLNQSLDEIVSTQKRSAAGKRRTAARRTGRIATAPAGGVQKNKQPTRPANAARPVPIKPVGGGDSKIVVSNLPKDVNEQQIKEYFRTSVGPIRRVEVEYGPGGQSRGRATVTFNQPDSANKAFNALNGLLVDNKPIKVEILLSADKAGLVAPAKTLTERITQPKNPKNQPKSAAHDKKDAPKRGSEPAGRGRKRGGAAKTARPTKKTAEELDSEMADYFEAGNQNENATAAPAGDAMEDDIL